MKCPLIVSLCLIVFVNFYGNLLAISCVAKLRVVYRACGFLKTEINEKILRLEEAINKRLADNNLKLRNVDIIQLVESGIPIPFSQENLEILQKKINEFFIGNCDEFVEYKTALFFVFSLITFFLKKQQEALKAYLDSQAKNLNMCEDEKQQRGNPFAPLSLEDDEKQQRGNPFAYLSFEDDEEDSDEKIDLPN